MYPAELLDRLEPRPTEMLIERDDPGLSSQYIYIPENEHRSTLAGKATIVKVGREIMFYKPDQVIFLLGGIGPRIKCGDRIVEVIKPSGIALWIDDDLREARQTEERHVFDKMGSEQINKPLSVPQDAVLEIEEGDPRGLRR
jgi:hypothetical protein